MKLADTASVIFTSETGTAKPQSHINGGLMGQLTIDRCEAGNPYEGGFRWRGKAESANDTPACTIDWLANNSGRNES